MPHGDGQAVRADDRIRVDPDEEVLRDLCDAAVEGDRLARLSAFEDLTDETGVGGDRGARHGDGVVGGQVVDDVDAYLPRVPARSLPRRGDGVGDRVRLVVGGHQDREIGREILAAPAGTGDQHQADERHLDDERLLRQEHSRSDAAEQRRRTHPADLVDPLQFHPRREGEGHPECHHQPQPAVPPNPFLPSSFRERSSRGKNRVGAQHDREQHQRQ
ncbi:hypothetical protein NWF34_22555 [Gordonia sp. GONU]|nr:hypothetical protein [Gordonia sp. GONU]MCR8899720.1 hypothetical protein [Gordonia sp. GONU]